MEPVSKCNAEVLVESRFKPRFRVFGREWIGFQVAGVAGLSAGLGLALALADTCGLSQLVVLAIFATGVLTFLALAMATKIVAGEEALTYYHHEIAVMAAVTLLVRATGNPVLPYLDITALGIGTLLAFGRVGCLWAGCCHGRPSRCGIRYGAAHVREGLPPYYAGVRLFPVQALESLLVSAIVAAGFVMLRSPVPGAVFAYYVVAYGAARFALEALRGDAPRPHWMGFSEAQWTSALVLCMVIAAEYRGALPFSPSHAALLVAVAGSMVAMRVGRRPESKLAAPRHVRELAEAVAALSSGPDGIELRVTSLGIALSKGHTNLDAGPTTFYSLSRNGCPLTAREAKVLADLIGRLMGTATGATRLLRGKEGVFHLLLRDSSGTRWNGEAQAANTLQANLIATTLCDMAD